MSEPEVNEEIREIREYLAHLSDQLNILTQVINMKLLQGFKSIQDLNMEVIELKAAVIRVEGLAKATEAMEDDMLNAWLQIRNLQSGYDVLDNRATKVEAMASALATLQNFESDRVTALQDRVLQLELKLNG